MAEVWKDIPGYPGYQASTLGRIRSKRKVVIDTASSQTTVPEKLLKQRLGDNSKYPDVTLHISGQKPKVTTVHRLVALAFLPNDDIENKSYVNHIDRIPTHNTPDNLEWCTNSENVLHGLSQLGDDPAYNVVAVTDGKSVKYVTSQESKILRASGSWVYGNLKDHSRVKRIWMHKGDVRTTVEVSEVSKYEAMGWTKGGNYTTTLDYIWINQNGAERRVPQDSIAIFLADGWKVGRCSNTIQGKKLMHNGQDQIMVEESEIALFEAGGWVLGSSKSAHNKGLTTVIDESGKLKQVTVDEKDALIQSGKFTSGSSTSGTVHIYKPDTQERKMVKRNELQQYLDAGWVKGRPMAYTKSKIWIYNEALQKNKRVDESEIKAFVDEGWVVGRKFFKKQK